MLMWFRVPVSTDKPWHGTRYVVAWVGEDGWYEHAKVCTDAGQVPLCHDDTEY